MYFIYNTKNVLREINCERKRIFTFSYILHDA